VASRARRQLRCGGAAALSALLGAAVLPQAASADTITAQTLLQQSTLVINQQSNVYAVTAPGSGTLLVNFEDIPWPVPLQSLNLTVDAPGTVLGSLGLGSLSANGELDLNVTPGTYYIDVNGQAAAPYDLGLYSLQVNFAPQGAPLPLPTSLLLLLAGLGLLAGVRLLCKRNESFMYAA
jgi:hypothetical protein